jgi:hypothetical protein
MTLQQRHEPIPLRLACFSRMLTADSGDGLLHLLMVMLMGVDVIVANPP